MTQQEMSEHATRAIEIHREARPTTTIERCGRQGDVVMRRLGDAVGRGSTPPIGGWVVARGKHGEHRVMAPRGIVHDDGVIDLHDGGAIVHTDTPNARHPSIGLISGRWSFSTCQELGIDGIVQEVKD